MPIRTFALSPGDPPDIHAVFGEVLAHVLDDAHRNHTRPSFDVPQGAFLKWINTRSAADLPSWSALEAAARGPEVLPVGWPDPIARAWPQLRASHFPRTVEVAVREAQSRKLEPRDCCRVLAYVAQAVRRFRVQPQAAYCPECLAPRASIDASHASHIGPAYAQKSENQDATRVLRHRSFVCFALADGVSTSLGSGYAAAQLADRFCTTLYRLVETESRVKGEQLERAALVAQAHLDAELTRLLRDPGDPTWADVRGRSRMPQDSALHLLQNTLQPTNQRWAPQLASTLVGGVAELRGDNVLLHLIRIGDGVVESTGPRERHVLLSMDPKQGKLEAAVSPGPLGKAAVQHAERRQIALPRDTELVLISSDGLTRGHEQSVSSMLETVCQRPLRAAQGSDDEGVSSMLLRAAAYADKQFRAGRTRDLFNDNLALIVIDCIPRRARR